MFDFLKPRNTCSGENRVDPDSWDDPEIRDEPYLDTPNNYLTHQEELAKKTELSKEFGGGYA